MLAGGYMAGKPVGEWGVRLRSAHKGVGGFSLPSCDADMWRCDWPNAMPGQGMSWELGW